jgi:hypothetical protein
MVELDLFMPGVSGLRCYPRVWVANCQITWQLRIVARWSTCVSFAVIGTLRRELFDHVIVLNERHLKRLMSSYLDYYHPWRTHQSLNGDAPHGRPLRAVKPCDVVESPAVHGLHRVYLPKAA